mmetsp:Transcript_14200/g.18532  ORF Transcript_14200/g.18532 Transcript_14200/m.18532 type:complete len:370 (-) Transcript_14200:195-1304(-)|eukprot:CAMPEP_0198148762 /NCGR_PEP_ID=MMETSP1443-20131203/43150_1 /TAXON_ID=186043 /ORGANISM="Entomoneis sp., Strain CCMP2396" /LENGTH=369 /DNA_ID=CAMNT_0043813551 /DNA_START=87 /DNA_END=1196 /DNA_ORIENTATION=-
MVEGETHDECQASRIPGKVYNNPNHLYGPKDNGDGIFDTALSSPSTGKNPTRSLTAPPRPLEEEEKHAIDRAIKAAEEGIVLSSPPQPQRKYFENHVVSEIILEEENSSSLNNSIFRKPPAIDRSSLQTGIGMTMDQIALRDSISSSSSASQFHDEDEDNDGDSLIGDYAMPGRVLQPSTPPRPDYPDVMVDSVPSSFTGGSFTGSAYDMIFSRFGLTPGGSQGSKIPIDLSPTRTNKTGSTHFDDEGPVLASKHVDEEHHIETKEEGKQQKSVGSVLATKMFGFIRLDCMILMVVLVIVVCMASAVTAALLQGNEDDDDTDPSTVVDDAGSGLTTSSQPLIVAPFPAPVMAPAMAPEPYETSFPSFSP